LPSPEISTTPTPAAAKAALAAPVFDIVRVEPSGETVVAGHAFPKAKVELRDGGRSLAVIAADPSGQFVILPEPLAAGEHALLLAAGNAEGEQSLSEIVRVTVAPAKAMVANKAVPSPTVAAIAPAPTPLPAVAKVAVAQAPPRTVAAIAPAQIASSLTIAATAPAQAAPPAVLAPTLAAAPPAPAASASAHLIVAGVRVSESGRLEAKGEADAGTQIRLALNGSYLAVVVTGAERMWSLTVEHGLTPGYYVLRAETLDASGHARDAAEARFAFASPPQKVAPTLVADASQASKPVELAPPAEPASTVSMVAAAELSPPKASVAAPEPTPGAVDASRAVVADIRTTMVVRGDNLWDLARKFYGDGLRYAEIYNANANQIRNPKLIFVGQVFVVPQPATH